IALQELQSSVAGESALPHNEGTRSSSVSHMQNSRCIRTSKCMPLHLAVGCCRIGHSGFSFPVAYKAKFSYRHGGGLQHSITYLRLGGINSLPKVMCLYSVPSYLSLISRSSLPTHLRQAACRASPNISMNRWIHATQTIPNLIWFRSQVVLKQHSF